MQRYRIPQSSVLLKATNGAAEGARVRSVSDGFSRPLHRPASIRERVIDRPIAVQTPDPASSASVPPSPGPSRGPIARFFSRMVEQLVNDFASGAAATHPEAYLMWLDYQEADQSAAQSDSWPADAETRQGGFNKQAGRRVDMQAYLTQPQPISTAATLQSFPDFEEAAPIHQDEPARRPWLKAIMAGIAEKMRGIWETRRGMAALYSMDDRMLKDIGISRYEIEQVVRYGRPRK